MQSKRYSLWCWLTVRRWWWYCGIKLGILLNWDLLGLLPIYPLAKASYSLLDRSHGRSKLVNGNYLRIHIPLI